MKLLFTKLIAFLLLLPAAWRPLVARAQQPLYLVYSVEGSAHCRSAGKTAARPLSDNAALYPGDRLSLSGPGTSVILVAENTEYIRLNKTGDYDIAAIQKMQRSRWKDDLSVKYFHLLWEEFFRPRPVAGHLEPDAIAVSTGGVSRGGFQLLAPATVSRTSMETQIFRWNRVAGAVGYVFRLIDEKGDTVILRKLTDTVMTLVLKDSLHSGERYRWALGYLSPKGSNGAAVSGELERVDETATLASLNLSLPDAVPGPLATLQRASVLETAGCSKAARESYERLERNYPDNKVLQKLTAAFLIRNGLPVE